MISKSFLMFNKWILTSENTEPVVVCFLNDNVFQYKPEMPSTWNIINDKILIEINNGFSKLEGYFKTKNEIIGEAKNKNNYFFDFKLVRLVNEINRDYLIENHWQLNYFGNIKNPKSSPIKFCQSNFFKYENMPSHWNLIGNILEIQINNGYVSLRSEILNGEIKGKAKNLVGLEWDFEIIQNIKNQKLFQQILNSKWELVDSSFPDEDYILKYFIIIFSESGKMVSESDIENHYYTWNVEGEKIIFTSDDEYITYTCELKNDIIKCHAKNIDGVKFDAFFRQIINKSNLVYKEKLSRINPEYKHYKFEIFSQVNDNFKWFAIWNYYPKNRFSDEDISEIDLQNRLLTFEFKNGTHPKKFAQIFANAILKLFSENQFQQEIENYTLVIIPASNKFKTDFRFKDFCENLTELTGLINGFDIISNSDISRDPIHQSVNRDIDLRNYIKINNNIKNKRILVIDDVRTKGRSSKIIFELLKENGAQEVIFMCLAKTIGFQS